MADNVAITAGSGTTIAADDVGGGVLVQRTKTTWGPDGTANDADVATGKPLPVQVRSATGLIPIGEPTDAKSTATDTTSVTAISIWKQISASVQAIATSIAGTLTAAVTQSGTWTVQPGNTANTTAWKVDGSAVTQPVSLASVPSHAVTNAGTFAVQATEADGANTTLGAKADAKSTATDTTSISAMAVWKQISASVQLMVFGAGTAAAAQRTTLASDDPTVTVLGAQADAASATTSIKAALRAIAAALGTTALDLGSGTGGTRTLRTFEDTAGPVPTVLGAKGDAKSTATDTTSISAMSVWKQISASVQSLVTNLGTLTFTNTRLLVRGEPRYFSAAAATLTRPANTTAYSVNDSISDNATAGSVTALSATLSDTNDDPICITSVVVDTNDTGLAASCFVRAYLYNSDPTASSGVGAGDNVAFSNKRAGFIGSVSGTFRAFSDGGKARLVPDEGSYIVAAPTSGAKTIYIQYQTLTAFTPSANSTTLIGTINGFQGRA